MTEDIFATTLPIAAASEAAQPNVIVILANNLRWGALGGFGHLTFKTPNLDRMAGDDAGLTQSYTPVPFRRPQARR